MEVKLKHYLDKDKLCFTTCNDSFIAFICAFLLFLLTLATQFQIRIFIDSDLLAQIYSSGDQVKKKKRRKKGRILYVVRLDYKLPIPSVTLPGLIAAWCGACFFIYLFGCLFFFFFILSFKSIYYLLWSML